MTLMQSSSFLHTRPLLRNLPDRACDTSVKNPNPLRLRCTYVLHILCRSSPASLTPKL